MTDDLIAFLTARLDEDEWMANVALGSLPSYPLEPLRDRAGERLPEQYAAHIARHDPKRGLREVEAGRRLLANYEDIRQFDPSDSPQERAQRMVVAEVVRMLIFDRAAVYSDHPDYRAEWKP